MHITPFSKAHCQYQNEGYTIYWTLDKRGEVAGIPVSSQEIQSAVKQGAKEKRTVLSPNGYTWRLP